MVQPAKLHGKFHIQEIQVQKAFPYPLGQGQGRFLPDFGKLPALPLQLPADLLIVFLQLVPVFVKMLQLFQPGTFFLQNLLDLFHGAAVL